MDAAIADGDFVKDSRGRPVTLDGTRALLQRVLNRLAVKQGSFVYDRTLGSRLYTLKTAPSAEIEAKALALVREALRNMPEVVPLRAEARLDNGGATLSLHVLLTADGGRSEVEVKI